MPPGPPPPPPYGQQPYGQQPYGQQPQGPYHQPPYGQPGNPNAYPPPIPPTAYEAPPLGYYGQPPKKTRWGLIIGLGAGALALLAIAAVVGLVLLGRGTVTATDVEEGDCLAEIPASGRVLTVQTVDCNQSHAGEVYAVLTMPEGDFPGVAAIERYQNKCEPELADYSPGAMTDDSIQMYVLYPTAETWEQGDRAVTCVATLDPPRTGSIKG
jgi:Septum formation